MKRLIILPLIMFSIFCLLEANIDFGIRAGMNSANVGGDERFDDTESRLCWHFGGLMQYHLNEMFILQPEILFSQKGTEFDVIYDDGDVYSYKNTFDYLEIPILVKYKYPFQSVEVQPYIGMTLSFLFGAEGNLDASEDGLAYSESIDIEKYMNNNDFGINIGLDANIAKKFLVGLRYNHGQSKIWDDDDMPDHKNQTWMINLGYLLK